MADYVIQEFYPDLVEKEKTETLDTDELISAELFDKNQEMLDGRMVLAPQNEIEDKLQSVGKVLKVPLNRYALLLRRIVEKTATLVAHWQAVGFVHGNLNTVLQVF